MTAKSFPRGGRARPRLAHFLFRTGCAALACCLLSSCSAVRLPRVGAQNPPVFTLQNHVHEGAIPAHVRRVAILPLHHEQWRARELAAIDEALRGELARTERFEIAAISRAELQKRFDAETFASASALPADFLDRLRDDFGADAVLFLDLAHYAPYQPIAIGLRAKLVGTTEGTPLWSVDAIFDAGRPEVANAARQFSTGEKRPGPAAEDSTGVLQSPSRFAKYVGHAVFETLPPRESE